ncbi:L-leucine/L-phenylalanine ABC transporter periplasmic binding protein [Rhodovastum atsumiense]|uniref:Branched-chain amino acid ABC transporter substrate-binding protein n=1 Tax=Rhodovastum atsumiense TaxID=504468 RepID=A0A5M6IQM0_9PROT|nr:branched-chain amino acid ABC transporter substrate-binding protein [Rhodovastum atsumiense]KAA5609775.1 branched-chain amino acid ABC transporter substrate-binding protein [Rhodovastum atsumiense]CAH2599445.1 L-leucine/L-phenylalanine ABC transporter periplasmic binding protein [Rhodovastum atsumiense]
MQFSRTASALAVLGALLLARPAAAQEDVVIGFSDVLSGNVAAIGQQALNGAQAAVDVINARGGVLHGRKLRLAVEDDACDPKQAVSVANLFAGRGIKLVLGPLCSSAAIPASSVYAEEGILMMSASATNPQLTERKLTTVFRACGRDDQQGAVAGEMLADRFANKRIAIVDDKSAYGSGLATEAAKVLKQRKVPIAFTGSVTAGEKDFSAIVSRLKQERIDIAYYGGYHPELGLILRQARSAGLNAIFVSGEGIGTSEFWAIAGDAGTGTLFTNSPDVAGTPAASEARKAIEARDAKVPPDNFAFYNYAAIQALAAAIDRAGSATPKAVAAALRKDPLPTVVGPLAFDAKGDLKAPQYVFFEWRDGTYHRAAF